MGSNVSLTLLHIDSELVHSRKYFRNSKEPYSISILGQTIYVITSPEDVQELYKNTITISWLRFVQDLYRWIGISQPNIDRLWQMPNEEQKLHNPHRNRPPNEMIEDYQHRQLLPGSNMEFMAKTFLEQVDAQLKWAHLRSRRQYIREFATDHVKLSLMDWTADVFLRTTTETYWGKSIWKVGPELLKSFTVWEESTWKYVYQLPYIFSKDTYAAKDQLIQIFSDYFSLPKDERADSSFFVEMAENELRDIDFSNNDIAKCHMLQHWA